MTKKFGTITLIGNKRVVKLRYTDMELAKRVVKFIHTQGYVIGTDYTVTEYRTKKGMVSLVEAIILSNHMMPIMAIKQRRTAELAIKRAEQLELW